MMKHCGFPCPISRRHASALLLGIAVLAGCANPAYQEGRALVDAGRVDEALPKLAQLARDNPEQREYRAYYFRQRELAVARAQGAADAARAAGQLESAEGWYRKALEYDPDNARSRSGLEEIAALRRQAEQLRRAGELLARGDVTGADTLVRGVLAQNPGQPEARALLKRIEELRSASEAAPTSINSPFQRPVTLEFRDAPIRSVFETMSRVAGVNFVFDKDVKPDTRITIFVRNTSIDEVMRLILTTNQLERKLLNDSSVLIYPNLPAKVREYQDLVMRTFYLVNADVKQVQAMVRALSKTRDLYVDEKLNALIVRDTPEAVRLVEKMVAAVDLAEPEVMLEIEVLEIASGRVQALGIQWPGQIQYGIPNVTGQVRYGGANGFVGSVANPVAIANLRADVTGTNTLANPRIRVRNREKAKIHIGDKLPVFTTTATANVGVSASVNYLDVGLKLEIESNVYLDNEVAIKLALEVSTVTKEVTGPSGSIAYQIGTRLANTVLRLRDGETQILAGLISDEDRNTAARVPGLGDLPVVGRLFGSQTDTRNKTEVVLLITPRVLRNLNPPESASLAQYTGTDAQFGAAPLRLRMTGPGSLGLQSSSGPTPAVLTLQGSGSAESGSDSLQARRQAMLARRSGGGSAASPVAADPAPVTAPLGPPLAASGAPPTPAAGAGSASDNTAAPVTLGLSTKGEIRPGEEFEVLVSATDPVGGRNLQTDLTFPADLLLLRSANASSQPGRATINLAAGAAPVRFMAVATAPVGATASIAIAGLRAADGSAVPFLAPAPALLAIKP
jgi:general secretion pathway protein D